MQTVMVSTQLATCQASGITRGLCMREWLEDGGPWIKGNIKIYVRLPSIQTLPSQFIIEQLLHCGKKRQLKIEFYFLSKRYIYWNAHFFGENFYGWSIGDKQSLSESGPFHSQGRIGASNQPWQGTWRANVSVELVSCNSVAASMRDFANTGWERGNIR